MGNGGLKKKKKMELIARMGIRGHIYYMNKKRQFLNSLWPFCMIKINLALKNLVILHLYRTKRTKFSMQCQLLCNFKRCKKIEPSRSQKTEQTMRKNPTQFDVSTRAWFPFRPNNVFFHGVSGGRAAEPNE